jgi:hypothetical protein
LLAAPTMPRRVPRRPRIREGGSHRLPRSPVETTSASADGVLLRELVVPVDRAGLRARRRATYPRPCSRRSRRGASRRSRQRSSRSTAGPTQPGCRRPRRVDEVYRVGGAQAIAASRTAPRRSDPSTSSSVGNMYVTAKRGRRPWASNLWRGLELVVVADDTADPAMVAADRRPGRARPHGAAILVTWDSGADWPTRPSASSRPGRRAPRSKPP